MFDEKGTSTGLAVQSWYKQAPIPWNRKRIILEKTVIKLAITSLSFMEPRGPRSQELTT
jgi:hypothetical protein